ncbi:MAG TPA: hypothetical protein VNO21_11295 [Polyangiaceae bacterium]|nr:hypothetical protein [Polyangiaceae bacterium]
MDLNANAILASFLIGSIGLVAFIYGKRQQRLPQMLVGVALMAYPYFVSNLIVMFAIAVALLFALWLAVRFGW